MKYGPKVTVLMAIYNEELFVGDTVRSILGQGFDDFEFLIIDDCSNDNTLDLVASFQDRRIRIVRNEVNVGLTASLHKGVNLARGHYIARIDAGDIAMADRLLFQVEYLDKNRDFGVVGSKFHEIDVSGVIVCEDRGFKASDLGIRLIGCLVSPFTHPSVMLRKSVLDKYNLNYNLNYIVCQDYELWSNILSCSRGDILQEVLVLSRLRNGISSLRLNMQLEVSNNIALTVIKREYPHINMEYKQVESMRALMYGPGEILNERCRSYSQVVSKYMEILQCFALKYRDHPEVSQVRKKEVVRVVRRVLYMVKGFRRIGGIGPVFRESPKLVTRTLLGHGVTRFREMANNRRG
jgi:glycosyltransferase involved in cell wall biosynthesis